jgi:hypothetical protein
MAEAGHTSPLCRSIRPLPVDRVSLEDVCELLEVDRQRAQQGRRSGTEAGVQRGGQFLISLPVAFAQRRNTHACRLPGTGGVAAERVQEPIADQLDGVVGPRVLQQGNQALAVPDGYRGPQFPQPISTIHPAIVPRPGRAHAWAVVTVWQPDGSSTARIGSQVPEDM